MKRLQGMILLLFMAVAANAQGIHFEKELSWSQVLAKAKAEHKYIFADVYATWCAPCKWMDENVYSNEKVGECLNAKFISVKVQLDTSKQDNEQVQRWYAAAHGIIEQNKITSVPTYLFFSPDGKIVHRFSGMIRDTDFIHVAENALNPDKQYYTLMDNYLHGKKNYSKMPYLANTAKAIGDKSSAKVIAKDYIRNYLDKSGDEVLYNKKNIDFVSSFSSLLSAKDKYFRLFYHDGDKIDKMMDRKNFSQMFADYIITREEIDSRLWPDKKPISGEPDWNKLMAVIARKYNRNYAERNVLNAKIRWYDEKKDWPLDIRYNIEKLEKYGVDTSSWGRFGLNNLVFSLIFEHSNDKTELDKGIGWMEMIMGKDPGDYTAMDTYANLLYKTGRTNEATALEEKALKLDREAAVNQKRKPDPVFQETVNRMKTGQPTWGQSYNQ